MRFSLYTEMQLHEGKSPQQLYARCSSRSRTPTGSATTATPSIEHFFFPKFSISAHPTALFAAAAQRTKDIRFRTMLHALPYYNPIVLASRDRGDGHPHGRPLRVGRRSRPRLDPGEGRRAARRDARPRYEEAVDLLFTALGNERVLPQGRVLRGRATRTSSRSRTGASGSSSAGRPTGRTSSRPSTAGASRCRRCFPTRCSRSSSTSIGRSAPSTARRPDIVWIHACHLDEDRDTALREARDWITGFIYGNSSPLLEYEKPDADALVKAGYGFYAAGIMEQLAEVPFEQLVEEDYVWVGTPDEIVERIAETRRSLPGHHRDRDHGQRRRRAALDGDQEPGAFRLRRDAARARRRDGGRCVGVRRRDRPCLRDRGRGDRKPLRRASRPGRGASRCSRAAASTPTRSTATGSA